MKASQGATRHEGVFQKPTSRKQSHVPDEIKFEFLQEKTLLMEFYLWKSLWGENQNGLYGPRETFLQY